MNDLYRSVCLFVAETAINHSPALEISRYAALNLTNARLPMRHYTWALTVIGIWYPWLLQRRVPMCLMSFICYGYEAVRTQFLFERWKPWKQWNGGFWTRRSKFKSAQFIMHLLKGQMPLLSSNYTTYCNDTMCKQDIFEAPYTYSGLDSSARCSHFRCSTHVLFCILVVLILGLV